LGRGSSCSGTHNYALWLWVPGQARDDSGERGSHPDFVKKKFRYAQSAV
jgi:hypothetical protein